MEYSVIRSDRRTLAVQITGGGEVVVRAPWRCSEKRIENFLREKSAWIEKHVKKIRERKTLPPITTEELKMLKEKTENHLREKLPYYAELIGVTYGKVTVRRQKSKWGSCNIDGNLSFNLYLAALPTEAFDYVIIHELCHRKRLDHSPAFWKLVEKFCPDYKRLRFEVRNVYSEMLLREVIG
ncbi:MAG: M48 family metallopeptidase [Clostridia bacterium]|nr:M48 family metallopeptidase [Clostridia bacterium]